MAPDSCLPLLHAEGRIATTLRIYEQSTFFSPKHSRFGCCIAKHFGAVWGDWAEHEDLQIGYLMALHDVWRNAIALQNYTLSGGLHTPMPSGSSTTTINLSNAGGGAQE